MTLPLIYVRTRSRSSQLCRLVPVLVLLMARFALALPLILAALGLRPGTLAAQE